MMTMVLGYSIAVPSNETFAYLDRLDLRRCGICDMLLDRPTPVPGMRLVRRDAHLSVTLDGLLVASEEFRERFVSESLSGLTFSPAIDDSGFHAVGCEQSVPFDAVRRKTAVVNKCAACRRYEQVVGTTPVMLARTEPLEEDRFYVTDLMFGIGDEQHPLLLAGARAAKVVESLGIVTEEVECT